ncbi:MAG: cell surface protein SprA [Bacteroidales bacterium]|nr:cell surface protein SprA [Bacteroidales bacterium]
MPKYAGAFPQFIPQPDSTNKPDSSEVQLIFPFSDNTGNPYLDGQNQSPLFMQDPANIEREVIYNPETNSYEFVSKIGDFTYRPPTTLDFKDYSDYNLKQDIRKYWTERSQTAGTAEGTRLIPKIHIGGEAFDKIFGSNTIDIRPQGSAEVSFGILHNRRDDPSLDVRQRKTTNFDFDMKIQMNVVAKIGDKIEFKANYNTESSFDFENTLKLKYEGQEDEIIQLIEAGNVSLPLKSTLIRGSQSLFGVKTELKFGKTTVTGVFSQQQSETRNISVQGGAQTNRFKLTSLDYEENKHFFLAHAFRDQYETALSSLPIITSDVTITRMEVWVTNIGAATEENRNIVAFADLGEGDPKYIANPYIYPTPGGEIPSNRSNDMLAKMDSAQVRSINTVTNYLTGDTYGLGTSNYFVPGIDFVKLENARKLRPSEYSYNTRLGFLSLNTSLNADQVLAVAVQYTIIGIDTVFQIGEFSDQGIVAPANLVVKLLKSNTTITTVPMWDLMMKNVYAIGAYQVQKDDFRLNILYSGNNNGVPTGYFTDGPEDVTGVPLIHLLGIDNLDNQLNPIEGGDGRFDFIDGAARQGGTFQASNGRLFFTSLEPFGSYIRDSVFPDNPDEANRYAFDSLYTQTKTAAEQFPDKNRFLIEGMYKSQSGSDISLNALNVPQGSVKVTAGGVPLVENVDYTVDYTLGRVKIINEGVMNSGVPINVSLESNSMFNVQQKRMMGLRFDHEINKDFHIGGTILNLHERPLTQKVNYGDDPISNTMWGLDLSYRKDSRCLTNVLNSLPGISTNVVSKLTVDAEFAQFIPGHSKAIGKTGTTYIDDFEGAKSSIDLKYIGSWFLASTPQGQPELFPEAQKNDLSYGMNRSLLSWYIIDPLFYDRTGGLRPSNVDRNEISKNSTRQVLETEVFPNRDIPNGRPSNLAVLNLAYYPNERGPYNYDDQRINPDGTLTDPRDRWAGIMRRIESSDFEATNIEYIEFWMMDPFTEEEYANSRGEIYINLGEISEDILRDGRKSYENGLPGTEVLENVDTTIWGLVPTLQALVESFSNVGGSRKFQDVGYEGLSDENEQVKRRNYLNVIRQKLDDIAYDKAEADPSSDNYHYFRGTDYDAEARYSSVTERYKAFNNSEGNSPTDDINPETYPTAATIVPNVEDINRDNTLGESERYFQYKVVLDPNEMEVGKNYITDIRRATNVRLANNDVTDVNWYQFKIPVQNPEKIVGGISDFRSIRFMRLFMKNFNQPIVVRFATFELVRSEWRRYQHSLLSQGEYDPGDEINETEFAISTVNIEENGSREPIPYRIPPGIDRQVQFGQTNYVRLNEQSIELAVNHLLDGDARGVFKTTDFDFRQYKKLKMFIHAENMFGEEETYNYGDMTVFIRVGSDFTHNYYEYEIPLEFTPWLPKTTNPDSIWPAINNMEIDLREMVKVKEERNVALRQAGSNLALFKPYIKQLPNSRITVLGNPNISDVMGILIGVRNPKRRGISLDDDGEAKSAFIWLDELRLTDFNDKPGWAGTGRVEATLADLGKIALSGSYRSSGFGSIDSKISEVPLEAISSYLIATDIDWGKFFGQKAGVRIPMHWDYGVDQITPLYNPLNPDVILKEDLDTYTSDQNRDSVKMLTEDRTVRQNLNFMNVRKTRTNSKKKARVYDIENFDASFAYSTKKHRDIDFEYDDQKEYRGGLGYNWNGKPKNYKPFGKIKALKSKHLALIKDFNIYLLPKVFSFRTDMNRSLRTTKYRNKSIGDIILYPTYDRVFNWNRLYDFKYDFSKSLTFELKAGANTYIKEPQIYPDQNTQEWEEYKQAIWNDIGNGGTMQRYNQTFRVNYNLPLKKIPVIDWLTLAASYQSVYTWSASPISIQERFGNTIENSNMIQLNSGADFSKLYNKVPYLKTLNRSGKRRSSRPGSRTRQEPDPKSAEPDTVAKPKINYGKIIGEGALKILMLVKKASLTYSEGNGTVLPGFTPEPTLLGLDMQKENAPGLGFVFGDQKDIRPNAVQYGWITTDSVLNNPYITKHNENLGYKLNTDILGAIRIDFDGSRIYTENYTAYFRYDPTGDTFATFSPIQRGNFSMSYSMISTSFEKRDSVGASQTYSTFLGNRPEIAERLARANPVWMENQEYFIDSLTGDRYPLGYGPNSQSVLYYSMLAAYSGQSSTSISINNNPFPKIPLPNWRITFNGLTNIDAIAKLFRSVNISSGYRSMLTINSWETNVAFDPESPGEFMANSTNYLTRFNVGVVSLMEQFSPLIGFDITMHNSLSIRLDYKKSRNLTMSYINNQLTEIVGKEVVVGLGYRVKNIQFSMNSINGGGKTNFNSDLNLKLDFGIRDNVTILRRIDEGNNQISAGSKQYTLNFSADYMLSQSLQLRAYYNWTSNTPYISAQFPNATTNGGFSLRFNLAQ